MEKSDKIILAVLGVAAIGAAIFFATRPSTVSNPPLGDTPLPSREEANSGGTTLREFGDFFTQLTGNGLNVAREVMNQNRIAQDRARDAASQPRTGTYQRGGGIGDAFGASK